MFYKLGNNSKLYNLFRNNYITINSNNEYKFWVAITNSTSIDELQFLKPFEVTFITLDKRMFCNNEYIINYVEKFYSYGLIVCKTEQECINKFNSIIFDELSLYERLKNNYILLDDDVKDEMIKHFKYIEDNLSKNFIDTDYLMEKMLRSNKL